MDNNFPMTSPLSTVFPGEVEPHVRLMVSLPPTGEIDLLYRTRRERQKTMKIITLHGLLSDHERVFNACPPSYPTKGIGSLPLTLYKNADDAYSHPFHLTLAYRSTSPGLNG
jgi:hypothetical protein